MVKSDDTFCLRSETLQCSTNFDLIDGATFNLPDTSFFASSSYNSGGYSLCAACSRLNAPLGWAPANKAAENWITVNLLETQLINAILTQGTGFSGEYEYVKTYKIATSMNAYTWSEVYNDSGNVVMIFEANTDPTTTVTNELPQTLVTRYVRLTVVDYNVYPTLRWEIQGCPVP